MRPADRTVKTAPFWRRFFSLCYFLCEGLVRFFDRPLDVQPMHFPVERVAADAELARDVADVAMLEIQLPEQGLALRSSERIERVHLGHGRRRLRGPQAETVIGRQIG